MSYDDLTREQRNELATTYAIGTLDMDLSWAECANALEIVGDDRLRAEYAGTTFVPEDFVS